jgi:hypothetical protein
MNDNHAKFEAKCISDLLERRDENGQYTSLELARKFYDARLIEYWKKIALENDLFRENSDYKALYQSKSNNYNRLKKYCERLKRLLGIDLIDRLEMLSDIILDQDNQIKQLKNKHGNNN